MNISVPCFSPVKLKLQSLIKWLTTCFSDGVMPGQGGLLLPRYAAYTMLLNGEGKEMPFPPQHPLGRVTMGRRMAKNTGITSIPGSCCQEYCGRKGEIPSGRQQYSPHPEPGVPASWATHLLAFASASCCHRRDGDDPKRQNKTPKKKEKRKKPKEGEALKAQEQPSHPSPSGASLLPPEHLEILNSEGAAANFGW